MPSLINNAPAELNPEDIKAFNQMIFENLSHNPEVQPGEFRHHEVWVAAYKGAPSADVPLLVKELCDWISLKSELKPS